MEHHQAIGPQPEADQTVRLQIDTAAGIRIGRLRADSGFANESFLCAADGAGLVFIVAARLTSPVQRFCRHADALWQPTGVPGLEVQEIEGE